MKTERAGDAGAPVRELRDKSCASMGVGSPRRSAGAVLVLDVDQSERRVAGRLIDTHRDHALEFLPPAWIPAEQQRRGQGDRATVVIEGRGLVAIQQFGRQGRVPCRPNAIAHRCAKRPGFRENTLTA
jgi:hypothetical protein